MIHHGQCIMVRNTQPEMRGRTVIYGTDAGKETRYTNSWTKCWESLQWQVELAQTCLDIPPRQLAWELSTGHVTKMCTWWQYMVVCVSQKCRNPHTAACHQHVSTNKKCDKYMIPLWANTNVQKHSKVAMADEYDRIHGTHYERMNEHPWLSGE